MLLLLLLLLQIYVSLCLLFSCFFAPFRWGPVASPFLRVFH